MSLNITDIYVDSCMFLNIDELYISNKEFDNVIEYYSIVLLNDKYYFKKIIQYKKKFHYEIIMELLNHTRLKYFNKLINEKCVTIKHNIYLSYYTVDIDFFGKEIIKRNRLLIYEKHDVIPLTEWNDTLEASNIIEHGFKQKHEKSIL